jgi:predicted DNA-binding transcriptional regulator YafY
MTPRSGGAKRSSWHTYRRRMTIVRLLLRHARSRDELIKAVRVELGEEAYPDAQEAAFKHDLDKLKEEYNCQIIFKRKEGVYELQDLGELALLDLSDTVLDALKVIEQLGKLLPGSMNLDVFADQIIRLLPPSRREALPSRSSVSVTVQGQSNTQPEQTVIDKLRRAIRQRQEIEFKYTGLNNDETALYRVQPYEILIRPEGHIYLDANRVSVTPNLALPKMRDPSPVQQFRLDRIDAESIKLLPNKLPAERIGLKTYQIKYRLGKEVARRRDVASYFPETVFEYHNDGSATVTASVTNLWQTRQVLLRYGHVCTVLEPPELVEMFRESAKGLYQNYFGEERSIGE